LVGIDGDDVAARLSIPSTLDEPTCHRTARLGRGYLAQHDLVRDLSAEEYLSLQAVVQRVARAINEVVPTERTYVDRAR
jgi:hypothetical protein